MNPTSNYIIALILMTFMVTPAMANGSLQHFSKSVEYSAKAAGHSSAAGMKLVSGVVAIPLMVGGEIGKASGEIGEVLWEEANSPLPITDDILTVGPSPAKAMMDEEDE